MHTPWFEMKRLSVVFLGVLICGTFGGSASAQKSITEEVREELRRKEIQQKQDEQFRRKMEQVGKDLQKRQEEHERYLKGEGIDHGPQTMDPEKLLPPYKAAMCVAEPWCTKEVATNGKFEMGQAYYNGAGIERNLDKAYFWYSAAGANGHTQSNVIAGLLVELHKVEEYPGLAVVHYELAAKAGSPLAMFRLGLIYFRGNLETVPMDRERALEYWTQAAKLNHKGAIESLDLHYTDKDPARNLKDYLYGAHFKDRWSEFKLGEAYEKGKGVGQDVAMAALHYAKAARMGKKEAQTALDEIYKRDPGLKKIIDDMIASGS